MSAQAAITPAAAPLPFELPRVALEKRRDVATETVLRGPQKLHLVDGVARHFTDDEKQEAKTWIAAHPEVPAADSGSIVYPDPYRAKVFRELKRLAEGGAGPEAFEGDFAFDAGFDRPEADGPKEVPDEPLPESAAHKEIEARVEAAGVARNGVEKADHSIERFLAGSDDLLEPYFAFRDGMDLSRIVKLYGVANIRKILDTLERVLKKAEQERPYFDREHFLAKAKRAVAIRRRDAHVGGERAAAEKAALAKPAEPESTEKRGREWASIDHIVAPRAARTATPLRKDAPWIGDAKAAFRQPPFVRITQDENAKKDTAQAPVVKIQRTSKQKRRRELERGLLFILEEMPDSAAKRQMVKVADLAVGGLTVAKIAKRTRISVRKVERLLREVREVARNHRVKPESGGVSEMLPT